MRRIRIMHMLLITVIYFLSDRASAVDCQNRWERPVSQTMSMDAAISFSLSDYKNGERHFSVKDSEQSLDIYYLKGAVLVQGYSQAQIEQLPAGALFMMPMAFTVPIMVLSEAVPKGPCAVAGKASFAVPLSGGLSSQGRKLTNAMVELVPSASGEVSYQLDVSIDPPAQNKTSVRYSGTMSFVSQQASPDEETDLTGYLVVTRSRPFPVAGSAGVPAKLGDLRRFVSVGQAAPKTPRQETLRDNDRPPL